MEGYNPQNLASITPNYGNISMSGNTDFETNEVSFSGSLCEEDGGISLR